MLASVGVIVFVVVVLLNLLIAIMGDSYEMIKENEIEESLNQRARIIVDFEQTASSVKAPRFLHTLELMSEEGAQLAEQPWQGVVGRFKQLMEQMEERQVRADTQQVEDMKTEFGTRVEQNTKQIGAVTEQLGVIQEQLGAVQGLLEKLTARE